MQEYFYQTLSGLDETITQLGTLIAKTGLTNIYCDTTPIVDDSPDFPGRRHVRVNHLESMNDHISSKAAGLLAPGEESLLSTVGSPAHVSCVVAVAQRCGIISRAGGSAVEAGARRLAVLPEDRALQQFYKERGILENPDRPILVEDLETLGLDLNEQGTYSRYCVEDSGRGEWKELPATMREVAEAVIAHINERLSESRPPIDSIKSKRYIWINIASSKIQPYWTLGLPIMPPTGRTHKCHEQGWLNRVAAALVEKGYLLSMKRERVWEIQA